MRMQRTTTGVVFGVGMLVACSSGDNNQTRQVDDYSVTLTTEPSKLEVGKDARVTAHIARDHQGVQHCRASFRQYIPTHRMTTDHVRHDMEELGQGTYRGDSSEFAIGGDWELELRFNCGHGVKTLVFPVNLQWM